MKQCMFLILCLALVGTSFAQDNDKREKVVTVDVQKSGDSERTVKVVLDDDGDERVIEWTDNGTIPADVREQLEEAGVEIEMLEKGESEEDGDRIIEVIVDRQVDSEDEDEGDEMIWIEKDGDQIHRIRKHMAEEKAYKMVFVDEDGNRQEMEWDGEGEMPEEMEKMVREHDMELHEEHDGKRGKKKIKKRMKHKGKDGVHKEHREMRFGQGSRKMKGDENVFVMEKGDHSSSISNTYMGAQVGSASGDDFVVVQEIIKDGPADKAGLAKGDQIHRINGARTQSVDGMMTLLGMFEPDDVVELTVHRDGKERKMKVTLTKRPDYYR